MALIDGSAACASASNRSARMAAPIATAGAAAPAHQYASRFLRARPIARPGAGEHARAARGPVAPRAQRLFVMLRGL